MTNIKLVVTGAKVKAEVDGVLTSGTVGIPVTIQYDSSWDGLSKTLVCTNGKWGPSGVARTILNIEESATVAHEALVPDQRLYLGIEGRNGDGTLVIRTVWADCGTVCPGADANAAPSAAPTLPIWAQLQQQINNLAGQGSGGTGTSQAEADIFVVTLDTNTNTADHTAAEIKAASDAGKFIVGIFEDGSGCMTILSVSATAAKFVSMLTFGSSHTTSVYTVNASGAYTNDTTTHKFVPESTSDDNGKTLQVVNGKPAWAETDSADDRIYSSLFYAGDVTSAGSATCNFAPSVFVMAEGNKPAVGDKVLTRDNYLYQITELIPATGGYGAGAELVAALGGSDSSQNVDLTGYATETYVQEYAQPKGDYLKDEGRSYSSVFYASNVASAGSATCNFAPSVFVTAEGNKPAVGDKVLTYDHYLYQITELIPATGGYGANTELIADLNGSVSSGSVEEILVVTLDSDTNTASHTAPEIYAAYQSGKAVLAYLDGTLLQIYNTNQVQAVFFLRYTFASADIETSYTIDESGSYTVTEHTYNTVPYTSRDDNGKILQVVSGKAAWVEAGNTEVVNAVLAALPAWTGGSY